MKKLVFGMGVTGQELARYLRRKQIPFDCYDDKKTHAQLVEALGFDEFQCFTDSGAPVMAEYDALISSPGPRQDHPLLVRARAANLPILAEVEFAYTQQCGKIVGITGSNGKSTTTSLIHHLLEQSGRRASLCGNIGVPLIAKVDDDPQHIYVIELSSFQLENVVNFRANVALLLNVSPDHIDWHGGFEGYERAKLNIFKNQHADDLAIVPPEYAGRVPGQAQQRVVPSETCYERDGHLCIGAEFSLPSSTIPLLGRHNHANVLFSCAAVSFLGMSDAEVAQVLPSFKGLEHRMQPVGTHEGRLWINDSKATNGHACQAAVDALDQPYVLIMGGSDKGERFRDLRLDKNPPKAIVAYGQTAPMIVEDLASYAPERVHLFRDAVLRAHQLAQPGWAVLLSPACASFDQFDNYGHRGRVFRDLFKECSGQP